MSSEETKAQPHGIAEARQARTELQATMELLRQRLDYPSRIDAALANAKANLQRKRRENPAVFIAGIAAATVITGVVIAGIATAVASRVDS